jgi:hypothetical protein
MMEATRAREARDPAFQGYMILRVGFVVAPILFGLDKFLNFMVRWPEYLAPWINGIVPGTAQQFMYPVGVIEILAGIARARLAPLGQPAGRGVARRDHREPAHRCAARVLRRRAA